MIDFRRDKGFTLIEILMAVFIGLILLGAIYVSMTSVQRSSAGIERKVTAQQDVRAALDIMAMEISMASYNPNFMLAGFWKNPPTTPPACTTTSVNQVYKGLQEATPASITVEMDIGESGNIGDNNNEIIRYSFANQSIFRNTNCQGDVSFLGDNPAMPAGTRTVKVINDTLGINNGKGNPAIFRYYDAKTPATELYPDTNPNDIPNIRRIDITLAVETEEVDPSSQQTKKMIYSTSVLVRNHVFN
jgi:prepilin-type N-terminal cleavage/methylation domain-containing protein